MKKITQALEYTESNDALVTLGIQPTRPDMGYGYIIGTLLVVLSNKGAT